MKSGWLFLALMLVATPLGAQSVERVVHVTGAPRSFQVVRVPVPPSVRDSRGAGFATYPIDDFDVLGESMGWVPPRTTEDALITLVIPSNAVAGEHTAARVVFVNEEEEDGMTEIRVTVTPVHELHIDVVQQLTDLRAGERVEIPYTLRNLGNTYDTVQIAVALPALWRGSEPDTFTVVIEPFGRLERVLEARTPRNGSTGSFFVNISARSRHAADQSTVTLTLGESYDHLRPQGAAVSASVGTVAVQDGRAETVPQVAVSGRLANNIQVDGRATFAPELNHMAVRGLANVGTFVTDPQFAAWTPAWRAAFGSTSFSMTDLTGVNAGGRGFSFEHRDSSHFLSVVGARTRSSFESDDHGELYGAHIERNLPFARVGATASHLRGAGNDPQELSALALQARSYPIRSFTIGGETAYRKFDDGSGMGWSAQLRHEKNFEYAELRVTHAPGGTHAFARAENEVLMTFVRKLGKRFDVAGAFADSRDDERENYAFRARSASLSPSVLLADNFRLRADVRHTSFDVDAEPIGYGNAETLVSLGGGGTLLGINYSADAGVARITRSIAADDVDAEDSGTRLVLRGHLSRNTPAGVFQLESNYERNSGATGYLPEQLSVNLRAERVALPKLPERLELHGELMLHKWTDIDFEPVVRIGADYRLPMMTTVSLGVERNPLLSGLRGGNTPWIVALKVEKSIGIPRFSIGRAEGRVYRDLNGNGRRDAGEPGVPDVAVRRGTLRVVTGSDGGYRFWEDARGPVTVEPASLPFGWIVGSNRDGEIGLVATTRLQVTIELGAAERARNLDVSKVVVIARDEFGREYIARRTTKLQAVFEALPVGRYTLDANFGAMNEPLRVERDVVVEVREGAVTQVILPIAGRPLRFNRR